MAARKWGRAAVILILLGGILFMVTMAGNGWDLGRLSTVKTETVTHRIEEAFGDIAITSDTAELRFVLSEDGSCEVTCTQPEDEAFSVQVADGVLTIDASSGLKWYEEIFRIGGKREVTVSVPAGTYGRLTIRESTGDITIPAGPVFTEMDLTATTGSAVIGASVSGTLSAKASTGGISLNGMTAAAIALKTTTGDISCSDVGSAGEIGITVSTGDVSLTNVNCASLKTDGSTGNLQLTNTAVSGELRAERSTGNIRFTQSDAETIRIRTSTGNVAGDLSSAKSFLTDTSTGTVDVPRGTEGGLCEIRTSTGDIRVTAAAQ